MKGEREPRVKIDIGFEVILLSKYCFIVIQIYI